VHGIVECAVTCGLPRARFADLVAKGGVQAPPSRYAGAHILRLWERVLRLSGDPIMGFRMALVAGLKTFGVLGQIAPRCATVLEAYRQSERYVALASQGARLSVTREASSLVLSVALDALPESPLKCNILLWGLTNWSLLPERLTGIAKRPKFIACAFPSPGADAVRALRAYCPFRFNADRNYVAFERSVSDMQVPSADADLKSLLAEVMDRHLEALGPAASFEQAIATLLREMMNGTMPTLSSVSARAGVSVRTLQRRLSDAKTNFQEVLQKVLRQEAENLLARGNHSQGEIAFLLGYSEVSAFSRAYRGWTGHPPGAARA